MAIGPQHRKDVGKVAPKLAEAIRGVLADQKAAVTRAALPAGEVTKTKQAVLPSILAALTIGAQRVAKAAGQPTPTANADLGGALAYKFATQFTSTTSDQLDALEDTATTDDVAGVIDARTALAAAIAATIVSTAINAGAQNYVGETLTVTQAPTKTWEVTDDNPCQECSEVDGETVPGPTTFSNGSPHGPIHPGCTCTVDWTASTPATTGRSADHRIGEPMTDQLWSDDEYRKAMATSEINDLPDATFAYIEPGGKKDSQGKTVPRSLRHYPIHDAAHVRNALDRAAAAIAGDTATSKGIAQKALPAIKAAAKKMGIGEDNKTGEPEGDERAKTCPTCTGSGKILDGHRKCPDCTGSGKMPDTKSARKPRGSRDLTLQTKCRRDFGSLAHIEVRAGSGKRDDGLVELQGQLIGYETPYTVRDMFGEFTETIHYGAARDLLDSPSLDVAFLVGHDASLVPLARTGAKASLELRETPAGLQVRALVDPRMAGAQELILGLENGTIWQMSVGMQVDPDADVWTGEDDHGMPDTRHIYRLANLFDASAVAFPANHDTSLELASARMAEFPPEINARAQHLEALAKEGRRGTLSQADSDALLHVLRHLFSAGETRNAPTHQDAKVSTAIAALHAASSHALATQAKDPDNNTDPVDKQVWKHLAAAHDSITSAMQAQGKDGAPDALVDTAGGNTDGTNGNGGNGGNAPVPDNLDGTGSRTLAIDVDLDLIRLRRHPIAV